MALRDLFRREAPAHTSGPTMPATSVAGRTHSPTPARWLSAGETVAVDKHTIGGGQFFVGQGLASVGRPQPEPALVDPSLPVSWGSPDWSGEYMGYWPSYHTIRPECRAAYLGWLASNRSAPNAYIGYVFLYFYGLERRMIVDLKFDIAHPDFATIASEVRRLFKIYQGNHSFRTYAGSFLETLEACALTYSTLEPPDPETLERGWEVPPVVRVGLGRYVAAGQAIPAAWAIAFLRTHPEAHLRTPARRCAAEFDHLFRLKYSDRFGEGLKLTPPKQRIELRYQPASAGFGRDVRLTPGNLPDVTTIVGPINRLRELADECSDALDSYSRLLGRDPESRATATAAGLLPEELLATHGGPSVEALRAWTDTLFASESHVVTTIDAVTAHWSPGRTTKLTKPEAVAMASLLAKLGVGMEPDVRFGAATPTTGSIAVLFPLTPGSPFAPTMQYASAALLVRLAGAVAAADGVVSDTEREQLTRHLRDALQLDPAEHLRLDAHLSWLAATGVKTTGLKSKLAPLGDDERRQIAGLLVAVAAADGVVSPSEITVLTKLYRQLGIDEAELYRSIHTLEIDDGPTTARAPSTEPRYTIPGKSQPAPGNILLDLVKVNARLAETAAVTAVLAGVFTDDEPAAPPVAAPTPWPDPASPALTVAGLDSRHSMFARGLLERTSWDDVEIEALATACDLTFVHGAIDQVNDAVIETCGEPLVEGDGPFEINEYAAEEIRR